MQFACGGSDRRMLLRSIDRSIESELQLQPLPHWRVGDGGGTIKAFSSGVQTKVDNLLVCQITRICGECSIVLEKVKMDVNSDNVLF